MDYKQHRLDYCQFLISSHINYTQIYLADHSDSYVAGALEDAGGKVQVQVIIAASNLEGLDETALEPNVREVLTQYGLEVQWEES